MTGRPYITDWYKQCFLPKVIVKPGKRVWGVKGRCWLWTGTGGNDTDRRPQCTIPPSLRHGLTKYAKTTPVTRMLFIYFDGDIDPALEVDHLCFNVLCVNPAHLELVTRAENKRRRAARITHCPQGHEYNKVNTYMYREHRYCKACQRDRSAA